jgi:tetratricopeptide (TPR) repeat protein
MMHPNPNMWAAPSGGSAAAFTRLTAALALCGAIAVIPACKSTSSAEAPSNPGPVKLHEPTAEQQARIEHAETARDEGNYDAALTMFQEILAENPTVTTAYLGIGDIYMLKEDYSKAEPAYGRAAKLEPRNFDAQYGHGLALQMLNRFVEAIRAFQRSLTIDPNSLKANLALATTYLQMDEPKSALIYAENAVKLDPANGSARVNLGAAYEKVGRNADAIEQYFTAMELVDDTPPLMMNLINALSEERRYQEAVNTAENLVKVAPSANAWERLGWCHFRLGDYTRSMHAYREAVKLDDQHWQSWNGIGVNAINTWLLSKKRDTTAGNEAREAFRRSLRLNGDQPKLILLMSNNGL